ncbi:MAG: beta-galactosidase [Alistipes sp.]|nr:beta-galactosidase [Alistipes sp.]
MRQYITLLLLFISTIASAASSSRELMSLNHDWQFYFVEDGISSAKYINIPHTWNDCQHEYRYASAYYVREFNIPADMRGKRLFLRFGGVQSVADVFVNGRFVGEHRGSYTGFTFEITDKVRYGEKNSLRVVVSNNPRADVLPVSTDQDIYGGIFRDVELLVTNRNIISPTFYGSSGVFLEQREVTEDRASGVVRVHLSAKDEGAHMVNMRIIAPDGYEVCRYTLKSGKADKPLPVELPFSIEYPELWSPDNPVLYRLEASVGNIDKPNDMVALNIGFRTVTVNNKNHLCINGKAVDVRGVNLAHDRYGVGVALCDDHLDRDVDMIQDMGANALRSLSGPHAQYLYERCDRDGMLVWVDLPLTCNSAYFRDIYYYPTEAFKANGMEQLREIVYQNYNHPSVVMWGIFSLVSGRGDDVVPYIRELNTMVYEIDSSRKTVACSNSDGDINFITDLVVLRQNVGWTNGSYEDIGVWCEQLKTNKKFSQLRVGVCYGEDGIIEHTTDDLRRTERGARYLPERNQTYMHEQYTAQLIKNPIFWGVWIDDMFDYASHKRLNGMRRAGAVAFDHVTKKDVYYLYRALWNKSEPTFYIAERHWQRRSDKVHAIKVYSSAGKPLLMINGESFDMREVSPACWCSDSLSFEKTTELRVVDPANRYSDSLTLIVDKLRVRR